MKNIAPWLMPWRRQKHRWKTEFFVMKGSMRCRCRRLYVSISISICMCICICISPPRAVSLFSICAASIFITFPFTNHKCDPNAITLVNACHSVKLYHFSVVNVYTYVCAHTHTCTHSRVCVCVCYGKKRINKPVWCLQRQLPSCPN